ncbi:MAG: proteasome assembly chaperone family protein, partial [Nitrososphaeria archaeon]|nr:proteasome assembly chaperone family protein [Nitrososphaeria archaeon]
MVGPHVAILKEALKRKVDSVILLAQSHYQYPDPGAASSVVNVLNRLLGFKVDVGKLLEQAEEIRLKTRETMQRTYKAMQKMQKMQEQELP